MLVLLLLLHLLLLLLPMLPLLLLRTPWDAPQARPKLGTLTP